MNLPRLSGLPWLMALCVLGSWSAALLAQARPDEATAPADFAAMQKLLDRPLVETRHLPKALPLADVLTALTKHLPQENRIALRLDRKALGATLDVVAATPLTLPPVPGKISLRRVLDLAVAKSPIPIAYRLGAGEVTLTTPERALCTVRYDIRDLVAQPKPVPADFARFSFPYNAVLPPATPAPRAARLVQELISALDGPYGKANRVEALTMQILNGQQLVIRASAAEHAQIADVLSACRRISDVSVSVQAQLYEVEDAFYNKLLHCKPVSVDEQERLWLAGGRTESDALFERLDKETPLLTGTQLKVRDGGQALLLSRHQVSTCLPSPAQISNGSKGRQMILEGVAFRAAISVSADRRIVRAQLTEKSTALQELRRVKTWPAVSDKQPPNQEKDVDADLPIVQSATHTRAVEIADGGSILVPVHYRPAAVREKQRWWVLRIQPRISIAEEEQLLRQGMLKKLLPVLVADVLQNPRLASVRAVFGTPGDKRFALLDSAAWTWPEKFALTLPGYQQIPVEHKGQRLLGLRVDHVQQPAGTEADLGITVTLVNAGGSTNGAVAGGGTLHYTARQKGNTWTIKLAK